MVDDKELDKFIEGELQKDITQEDKIDESVEQHMGEMGFLWNSVQQKMLDDSVCFVCKKEQDFKKAPVRIVEASGVEKGVVAFISICEKCYNKEQKKEEEKAKVAKK